MSILTIKEGGIAWHSNLSLEILRIGTVLVVTAAFFTDIQRPLPDGTRNLWFNPPTTPRQAQQRLGLGMSSHGVEIVLFRAVPPVTPADELVETSGDHPSESMAGN